MGKILPMEQKVRRSVNHGRGGGNHGARISALEERMAAVETGIGEVVENTREMLAFVTATKSVGGFARKHGPRAIAFGTGLLAAAGVGNPAVWRFIGHFFGG